MTIRCHHKGAADIVCQRGDTEIQLTEPWGGYMDFSNLISVAFDCEQAFTNHPERFDQAASAQQQDRLLTTPYCRNLQP